MTSAGRASRRAAALVLLAGLSACGKDAPNPFVPPNRTTTIPADARFLFTSNAYSTTPGAPRDVYAAREDGGGVVRLTYCNEQPPGCDTIEAMAVRDRGRLVMRRVAADSNRDGRLSEADDAGLVAVDLLRGLEATIVPPARKVSGVDWAPDDELVLYSGTGDDRVERLYRIEANGRDDAAVSFGGNARDRRPRINASGNAAVYERVESDGRASVWLLANGLRALTAGPASAGAALAGTPYAVGAESAPDFAPDDRSLVFRRLTGTGLAPFGTWDVLSQATDGSNLRVLAGGPLHRGEPDWGPNGILHTEFDGSQWRIVNITADGSSRRVLVTLPPGRTLSHPRWLR